MTDTIDSNIKLLNEEGFEVIIRCRDKKVELTVCRDEWVTDDLSRSVVLPAVSGKTLKEVVERMCELVSHIRTS